LALCKDIHSRRTVKPESARLRTEVAPSGRGWKQHSRHSCVDIFPR
jgi:hypothetical protein